MTLKTSPPPRCWEHPRRRDPTLGWDRSRCWEHSRRIVSLIVLVGISSLFSASAMARSCDPTDNDIAAAKMTITRVNTRIDRLETSVVQTLKLHAGQISAYITQQTTAIGRMFDAQNQSNAQIARETAQITATRDFAPSTNACETVSGVLGSRSARQITERSTRQATEAQTARLTNSIGSSAQRGQAQDSAIRWNSRLETWCNPDSVQSGSGICAGQRQNHNADINPRSLFGVQTLETDLEQQAARDFITNLIAPITADPLPLQNVDSAQERRLRLKRISTQSRLALASDTLNARYAERLPAVNLGAWANAILPEGSEVPENISMKELQSILMRSRFEDPNYFIALQAMEPENVRREMATNQALMLSLLYSVSESLDLLTTIEATRLATEVEKDLLNTPGGGATPGVGTRPSGGNTPAYPGTQGAAEARRTKP